MNRVIVNGKMFQKLESTITPAVIEGANESMKLSVKK
jgi:hypothetical protein